MLNVGTLIAVGASRADAIKWLPYIVEACREYEINTVGRLAPFLAQVAHESGGFRYTSELWGPTAAQKRYEGRKDLGNTEPGDGSRFRGHGLLQTTGRFNHARVRDRLRKRFPSRNVPDFEAAPDRLTEPEWAALSAADYWDDRGLNRLADAGQFTEITQKVNGGQNGADDRRRRYAAALIDLRGAEQPAAPDPEAIEPQAPEPPPQLPEAEDPASVPWWRRRPPPRTVSTAPAEEAVHYQESAVSPFVPLLIAAVTELVPKLAPMFGSGSRVAERNTAAAMAVAEIAKQAIGAANEQAAIEAIRADPAAAAAVRAAVEREWFHLEEIGGGIAAARAANAELSRRADGGMVPYYAQPAFVITCLLMLPVYYVVGIVLWPWAETQFSDEVRLVVVTAVISGLLSSIGGFWLGTSFSSQKKDATIDQLSR